MFDVVFHFGLLLSQTPPGSFWMPGLQRSLYTSFYSQRFSFFRSNVFVFITTIKKNEIKVQAHTIACLVEVVCLQGIRVYANSFISSFVVQKIEVSYMHSMIN